MFRDRQRGFQARGYWQEMNKRSHRLTSQSFPWKWLVSKPHRHSRQIGFACLIDLVSAALTHSPRIHRSLETFSLGATNERPSRIGCSLACPAIAEKPCRTEHPGAYGKPLQQIGLQLILS